LVHPTTATIDGSPSPARAWLPEDFDAACPGTAIIQPGEYRLVKYRPSSGPYMNNTGDDIYLCSNRTIPATVIQLVTFPDTFNPINHEGFSWSASPNGSYHFDWATSTLCASNSPLAT
jgi:hypothetical protein